MEHINEISRIKELMNLPLVTENRSEPLIQGLKNFFKGLQNDGLDLTQILTSKLKRPQDALNLRTIESKIKSGIDNLSDAEIAILGKNIDGEKLHKTFVHLSPIPSESRLDYFKRDLQQIVSNKQSVEEIRSRIRNLKVISRIYRRIAGIPDTSPVPAFITELQNRYNKTLDSEFMLYFESTQPQLFEKAVKYGEPSAKKLWVDNFVSDLINKDAESLIRVWKNFWRSDEGKFKKFAEATEGAIAAYGRGDTEKAKYFLKIAGDIQLSMRKYGSDDFSKIYYGDKERGIEGWRDLLTDGQRKVLEGKIEGEGGEKNPFLLMMESMKKDRDFWEILKQETRAFRKLLPISPKLELKFHPEFIKRFTTMVVYQDARNFYELLEALKRRGYKGEIWSRVVSYILLHKIIIPVVMGTLQTGAGAFLANFKFNKYLRELGINDYESSKDTTESAWDNIIRNWKAQVWDWMGGDTYVGQIIPTYLDDVYRGIKKVGEALGKAVDGNLFFTEENAQKLVDQTISPKISNPPIDSASSKILEQTFPKLWNPAKPKESIDSILNVIKTPIIQNDTSTSKDNTKVVQLPKSGLDSLSSWK